jgi:4-hydroxy-tetrahydrodipicolinate reductase
MAIKVCVAGATGWTGSAVVKGILSNPKFELVGAVARSHYGDLGSFLGLEPTGILVSDLDNALAKKPDVLIDYTQPSAVKANTLKALAAGVPVVIGTSGLTAEDFEEIAEAAAKHDTGVIASGNFSITATLAKHFSLIAAQYIPHWELIDYAKGSKVDVPSGTVRELAEALGNTATNQYLVDPKEHLGPSEARGAEIGGGRVHGVRLPGYVIAFESIFGLPDERLTIRHDAGNGAEPYVGGTLLAAEKAVTSKGVVRGLDQLLFPQ